MPSPVESKAALRLITGGAVAATSKLLGSLSGPGTEQRSDLLATVPELIAYYADGSAALAADFYDDQREAAGVDGSFTSEPTVPDRSEKIRSAIAWAAEPLITGDGDSVGRLAEVVQLESARPYRATILANRNRDPAAVGWRRIASASSCKFCKMLADRGAVYRMSTARFAAHTTCHCTAQPVFDGQAGAEVDVIQYIASKRRRTAKERQQVREYLATHY